MRYLGVLCAMLLAAGYAGARESDGQHRTSADTESTLNSLAVYTGDVRSTHAYLRQSGPTVRPGSYIDDGRVELAVWGSGYGILNGILLAAAADGGPGAYALGAVTGGAVGFGTPWIWSTKRDVSAGRASLMAFGGSWGMWQGLGWPYALSDDPGRKAVIYPGIVAGAVGLATAGYLTSQYDLPIGDVELIRSVTTWTSLCWLWGSVLAGAESNRFLLGSTLAAGNVGIGIGTFVAQHVSFSQGDVRLINLGGALGALTGGAIVVIADVDNSKAAYSTIMGCAIAGTAFAWWAVTPDQAAHAASGVELGPTVVRSPENAMRGLPALGMRIWM